MEEKKNITELKTRVLTFYKENKLKLFSLIIILILAVFLFIFVKIQEEKKNQYISEKYIQAGLLLTLNKNNDSKKLLEEIILSENKFYSSLSLNLMLEKNLENEKKKILEYFEIIESLKMSKEEKELVLLKKSLYLIKIGDNQKSKKLLKSLIDKNSNYKSLAEEILRD